MSSEQQLPSFPELRYLEVQTSRTVRGGTLQKMAACASQLATERPAKFIQAHDLEHGTTHRVAFTRTSEDINTLYLAWFYRASIRGTAVETLAVALAISDSSGHAVGPSDARIPYAFQGHASLAPAVAALGTPAGSTMGGEGWLDLDALSGILTDPDWSFAFTVTRVGATAYVDRIEGFEVPRGTVRAGAAPDDDIAGALTGPYNAGNPIMAGSVADLGLLRLEATLQAAVARCTQYLSLAWPCDLAAPIPQTTSGTFAAFVNFKETGTTNPVSLAVRVLPKYVAAPPGTAAGERGRFRVLFYVTGGGTAQVRLETGATASPYDTGSLTGASWQWSPWIDCELPTDATGQLAHLTFRGLTSAGTLYLAGAVVEERAA